MLVGFWAWPDYGYFYDLISHEFILFRCNCFVRRRIYGVSVVYGLWLLAFGQGQGEISQSESQKPRDLLAQLIIIIGRS